MEAAAHLVRRLDPSERVTSQSASVVSRKSPDKPKTDGHPRSARL
jgi:hypothetical protein